MIPLGPNMESQVTDYLVHDTVLKLIMNQIVHDMAFHISPQGIRNQIVHDLAFHIRPQGYHEPSSP
jgi:hypothetical protein